MHLREEGKVDLVNKRYLALAIAVSLGCGFADSMSVAYAEEAGRAGA